MFGLGLPELLLILVIGLIFFGPGKLPEIGSALGKSMKEFKQAVNSTEAEIKRGNCTGGSKKVRALMDNGSPLNNDDSMTLTEHLGELRTRILRSLAALAAGTCISGAFIDEIIAVLTAPAANLYYMRPAEAFFIYIKVVLACGVLIASPVLFYELWAFLVPALTGKERTALILFVPASVLLFWAGIGFAYFFVFPQGLNFFTSFAGGNIAPMLSIESYLDFFLMLVVPFGFIFNLPMVLIVLAQMGAVSSLLLKRGRKYMVLASFILAAIITPTPDVITQTLLAVPMILLYEGSRVFIHYILRK